jgi:uncharacterized membrane protein
MVEFTYRPHWLWLVLGGLATIAFLFWSFRRTRTAAGTWRRTAILALRFVTLAVIVICLLDPQRVEREQRSKPVQLAVVVDTSMSMGTLEGAESRLGLAKDWLHRNLPPNLPVSWFGFSDELHHVDRLESLTNVAGGTEIGRALNSVLNATVADSDAASVGGVLLVSDGRDNGEVDPIAVARKYGQRKVPLITLTIGNTNEISDIILEDVRVPHRLAAGASTTIKAVVRAPGFKGVSVPIRLLQNLHVAAETNIVLSGDEQTVEMSLASPEKGFGIFRLEIPPQPGERLTNNNCREFGCEVVDSSVRVLYMEGTGDLGSGPECLFLHHSLSQEPGIKIKTLYRNQGAESQHDRLYGVFLDPQTGDRIYRVENPNAGYPKTLDELLQFDVVIDSDIPKEAFSEAQLENTRRFVEEYGGGFVMVGGFTSFGAGGNEKTPLERIIPVMMDEEKKIAEESFKPIVPSAAFGHPIMQVGSDAASTRRAWLEKLPEFSGFNRVDRAKPGAVVLLQHPQQGTQYGPYVILAVQEIGKGRSMAFTSDTTAGWGGKFENIWGEPINENLPVGKANCDERYYRQFWANAIRWLGAGRALNSDVRLELSREHIEPNQSIGAAITLPPGIRDAEVNLTVISSNQPERKIQAHYDASTGDYRAKIPPVSGRSIITAAARVGAKELGTDHRLLSCEGLKAEEADVRADPRLMTELAVAGGGEALSSAKDFSSVMDSLSDSVGVVERFSYHPLWDKPIWLLLIISLLAAEWIIRRSCGLA